MKNLISMNFFKNSYVYSLILVLATLPLNFAFGSISCLLFILISIFSLKKKAVNFFNSLLLPIIYYLIMALSMSWSQDINSTISCLQKEIMFFIMPATFFFSNFKIEEYKDKIFKYFSYSLVLTALFFITKACINFYQTHNFNVFFYHTLVSLDLNAIYIGAFSSFAFFYFFSLEKKDTIHYIAIGILAVFIFLLSSKIIFFIGIILIIIYYIYFSKTHEGVKVVTILSVIIFAFFSVLYVPQIKESILKEYETAFVDNTLVEEDFQKSNGKFFNVSLNQAWNSENFDKEHFFPGTALRVFQIRIFKEILHEQNILFTGFGLGASQPAIEKKVEEHNLFLGYKVFNFHNQYIQTFAELGIFGFLTLTLMLIVNLKNAINNKNFLHLVFALTMIILLLTESMFCRQRGIIFFVTMYCIFNTFKISKKANEKA